MMDFDWQGRTTARAEYATALTTWTTDYTNYVHNGNPIAPAPITARYHDLKVTYYHVLERVFRSERYPGNLPYRLQTNNYYDRNGMLVCSMVVIWLALSYIMVVRLLLAHARQPPNQA